MENEEKELEELLENYSDLKENYSQERFVELLREVQELFGCIPQDIQEYICERLCVKMTVIRSILKFFPSLHSAVKHRIVLCTGPNCKGADSLDLAEVIEEEVHEKRKKKDGGFYTFTTQNCLKHCQSSPNMSVDGKIYQNLTKEEVRRIIQAL